MPIAKHKLDPKLVSMQIWERYWIRWRYGIPKDVLNEVIKLVGKSRKKVYAELRKRGYLNVPDI